VAPYIARISFCSIPYLSLLWKARSMSKQQEQLSSLKQLITNCIEKGSAISDAIEFRYEESGGIGVFATSSCSKGNTLISIPLSLCLTSNAVVTYEKLSIVFENEERKQLVDFPDEVLAIGLMYSLTNAFDVDCPWRYHVATLPRSFNTTIFWSEEEMNELRGHNVFHLTNMLKKRISDDFDRIYSPLITAFPSLFGNIDLDIYIWALSIVYSRALDITVEDEGENEKEKENEDQVTTSSKHERVIVPVLDMLNHNPSVASSAYETFLYDQSSKTVNYLCSIDVLENDQLFAVYGNYCNAKLLYTYGFVIMQNPVKAIDLWTRVPPSSPNYEVKQEILQSHPLTANQTYDFSGTIRSNYVSLSLLATIRVIQATTDELTNASNAFEGKMISVRNELATYSSLKELIKMRMKAETAQVIRDDCFLGIFSCYL
jgi:hypothetical protein